MLHRRNNVFVTLISFAKPHTFCEPRLEFRISRMNPIGCSVFLRIQRQATFIVPYFLGVWCSTTAPWMELLHPMQRSKTGLCVTVILDVSCTSALSARITPDNFTSVSLGWSTASMNVFRIFSHMFRSSGSAKPSDCFPCQCSRFFVMLYRGFCISLPATCRHPLAPALTPLWLLRTLKICA